MCVLQVAFGDLTVEYSLLKNQSSISDTDSNLSFPLKVNSDVGKIGETALETTIQISFNSNSVEEKRKEYLAKTDVQSAILKSTMSLRKTLSEKEALLAERALIIAAKDEEIMRQKLALEEQASKLKSNVSKVGDVTARVAKVIRNSLHLSS